MGVVDGFKGSLDRDMFIFIYLNLIGTKIANTLQKQGIQNGTVIKFSTFYRVGVTSKYFICFQLLN